jgi:hypothetical protein
MHMKWMRIGLTLSVHPSIHMIQLENCLTDMDEVLYGIGVYPKIVLFNFLQLVILTWQMNELLMLVDTSAPYNGIIQCCVVIDFQKI